MRSPNEQKMFEMLLDEIDDTLNDIEQRCLRLEGAEFAQELKIIFRAAHNIKGASQLYGLTDFGGAVHVLEDLLNLLTESEKPINPSSVDVLLKSHSFLSDWVSQLRDKGDYVPDSAEYRVRIIGHIDSLKNGTVSAPSPKELALPVAGTGGLETVTAEPPPQAMEAAAQTEESPSVENGGGGNDGDGGNDGNDNHGSDGGNDGDGAGGGGEKPRGNVTQIKKSKSKKVGTLRIPSTKIDEIMQLIGELSIHQSILWHGYNTSDLNSGICRNAVALNQKALKDLHNMILTLRMQPVESLFQRIERIARDVARDLNKKIQINLIGSEVPLDKTVIEMMVDPMMHLVRNAIDHGIEDEDVREKLGKPVPARLTIQAQQDAGMVVISITDDGRGIDPQIVYDKAVQKGLITTTQKLSDDEIINLIFLPGFSTRDQVTAVSGRGVGMDVVQQAIQQLGGRIETISRKGQGTSFQISLPTSLEIIEGLVIRVGKNTYIAPMQDVIEIVDLGAFELEKFGQGGWAIQLRDHLVPVENLSDYIGTDDKKKDPAADDAKTDSAKNVALIIRLADRSRLALKVDGVLAQQQIVVRPLNDQLVRIPGFTGVTILGNGEPGMILSVPFVGECYLKWVSRQRRSS